MTADSRYSKQVWQTRFPHGFRVCVCSGIYCYKSLRYSVESAAVLCDTAVLTTETSNAFCRGKYFFRNDRFIGCMRIALLLILSTFSSAGWSETVSPCAEVAGIVVSIQGRIKIDQQEAKLDQQICTGEVVSVGANSRGGIRLSQSNTVVRIDSMTEVVIKPDESESFIIDLLRGIIYLMAREPDQFVVETPYVNAAIDGTEFVVSVNDNASSITLIEGAVRAQNDEGEVLLKSGEQIVANAGKAPEFVASVSTFSAVQWALYYPPIEPDDTQSRKVQDAATLVLSGKGREAIALLEQARSENPEDAAAAALQSIIATVMGQKSTAMELAKQAIAIQNDLSIAYTALSFAEQAYFRLDHALDSAETAVSLASSNAYAWARLAELQAASGKLESANESAMQAAQIDPGLSRTQSVLGFIRLARHEIGEAAASFDIAVRNDSADPLARLGAGLVKMRKSSISAARADIEVAASLDPGNSLIRSYLGKAYYTESRQELAKKQFDLAISLDENDPTPWLYAAIQSQTLNRPVEALEQLRESIRRNNNRAVYRSRLDLDSDLTSRQTRQGLVYNDLGFGQAALLEGWKSLALTPTNFAAHRLLADSYLSLPRHQFARDSELLQSQMLQPLNLVPIQPNLSFGDLSLVNDTSPRTAGISEYSRLFVEKDLSLNFTALTGANNTRSADVIVSGIAELLSFSLGKSRYQTDGVRENNDSRQDTTNAFLQFAPRYDTSIQFEYREVDRSEGDRPLYFNIDYSLLDRRVHTEKNSWRIGVRHDLSHRQTLTANYSDVMGRTQLDDVDDSGQIFEDFDLEDNFEILEARHDVDYENVNLNFGVSSTSGTTSQVGILNGEDNPFAQFDVKHLLAYSYADLSFISGLTVTTGASYTEFENSRNDYSRFNPKLGMLWNVAPGTTFRGAYTRNVKRPFSSSQTLEPVSVSGFNQLFNDPDGSIASRAGLGIDHWFNDEVSAGAEYSVRELEIPTNTENVFANEDERLARIYAYWTPDTKIALSAEGSYENFDLDPERRPSEEFSEMTLFKLPLSIRYFNSKGAYVRLTATYVKQDGRFNTFDAASVPQTSEFAITDVAFGYKLLNRRGLIAAEIRNIFDESFQFQNSGSQDLANESIPAFAFERQFFINVILNF